MTSINAPTKDTCNLQELSSPISEVLNQNQFPYSSFKPDTSKAQVTKKVKATAELSSSVPLVSEQPGLQHVHVTNTEDISSSRMMNSDEKSNGRDFTKSNSTKETVLNHDLVILIDSNGKSILPEKLYPGYSVKKILCMTIEKGFEIINSAVLKKDPKIILLHTGTNNLDHEKKEALEDHLINLTSLICHRFPLSKLMISSLLPRKDQLIGMVKSINATLEQRTLHLPNAHFISHFNLFDKDLDDILIDNKHLNQHSLKRFVRNFKDSLLGGRNKSQIVRQNRNRGQTFSRKPRLQDNRYRNKVTWHQPPVRRRQDVPNAMDAVSFSNWNQRSQPFIPYSVSAAPFQQGRNMMNYTIPPGNTQPNQSKVVQLNPMDNVSFNNFLHMLYEKVMC